MIRKPPTFKETPSSDHGKHKVKPPAEAEEITTVDVTEEAPSADNTAINGIFGEKIAAFETDDIFDDFDAFNAEDIEDLDTSDIDINGITANEVTEEEQMPQYDDYSQDFPSFTDTTNENASILEEAKLNSIPDETKTTPEPYSFTAEEVIDEQTNLNPEEETIAAVDISNTDSSIARNSIMPVKEPAYVQTSQENVFPVVPVSVETLPPLTETPLNLENSQRYQTEEKQTKPWYKAWQTWILILFGIAAAILATWAITESSAKETETQITETNTDATAQLEATITSLENDLETAQSENAALKDTIETKEQELSAATQTNQELTEAKTELDTKLANANEEIAAARNATANAQNERDNLQTELNTTKNTLTTTQRQRDAWKQTANEAIEIIENADLIPPAAPNN